MNFNKTAVWIWSALYISALHARTPFLSSLQAGGDSPIYTTYAAARERSEFILDQGFHLVFSDPDRGIEWTTDTAGDWCLAFKIRGRTVEAVKDMHKPPVIRISYPDLVVLSAWPFPEAEVEITFLVYSSRLAVLSVRILNRSGKPLEMKAFAFLRNRYRTFEQVDFDAWTDGIRFFHEELPDGWVLDHDIPYVSPVSDAFILSPPPDRRTSFRSYRWGEVLPPHAVDLGRKPVFVVQGRMTHEDGQRCTHSPGPRFMALLADESRILTETAPRWGSAEENINRYSFYGVEMGNLEGIMPGDPYRIVFRCGETGLFGTVEGNVTGDRIRRDVVFKDAGPEPPKLEKDVWGSGTEIRLYWKSAGRGVRYHVYRRDYRKEGFYTRVAESIDRTFYTDKAIEGDKIYGYRVAAVRDGRMGMVSEEVTNITGSDLLTDMRYPDQITTRVPDLARVVCLEKDLELNPGAHAEIRVLRAFGRDDQDLGTVLDQGRTLLNADLRRFVRDNEALFRGLPRLQTRDPEKNLLYYSAFNLMRQVMLPPEGKAKTNYYVFSREPTWGWGHGGQVFHESLTIPAYAILDSKGAMDSQRLYRDRQAENGYINYRTGPYLDETIPTAGELTSSAPWYCWVNWEVYKITRDKKFLQEMYNSGRRFYEYYTSSRDKDGDGLCEWGAHAVLESVRDAYVAVWDEVAWPSFFEGVDVNAMLVSEARALAEMAEELGIKEEAIVHTRQADNRAALINRFMWDEERGFYFHVDRKDHDFTHQKQDDLKREEITGFLPLWAEIASPQQAARLVSKLKDPSKFWRPFGIPSLSADDPYYNPRGYWNGPVWVQWNALIVRGLLRYGYAEEARELTDRVAGNMIALLKRDHTFWEFYSPDEHWGGYHQTYIWAGIIAAMLAEAERSGAQ